MICEYGNSYTLKHNDFSIKVTFSKLDKDTIDIAIWKIKQIFNEKNFRCVYYDLADLIDPSDEKFNGISYFVKRINNDLNAQVFYDSGYRIAPKR